MDDPTTTQKNGVRVLDVLWAATSDVTPKSIAKRSAIRAARRALTWCAGAFVLLGAAVFALDIVRLAYGALLTFAFVTRPSWGMAGLCIAVLSLMFLWYVRASKDDSRVPVPSASMEAPTRVNADDFRGVRDIIRTLDDGGKTAVELAFELARRAGNASCGTLHLFAGATDDVSVRMLLARLGMTFADVKDPLRRRMATLAQGDTRFDAARGVLALAFANAVTAKRASLSALEIFAAAVEADAFLQELFLSRSVPFDEFTNAVAWMRIRDDLRSRYQAFHRAAALKPTSNMNRAYTAIATPFLDSVSVDVTRNAVFGRTTLTVGRDAEMRDILRAFESGTYGVILVGPPGVGKHALIEALAERMVEEDVPPLLRDKRLLELSVPHIVSGDGGGDERLLTALGQVGATGNVAIAIENVHELVGGVGVDLSSILGSELEKGYTTLVATTTPEAYANIVERSILGPKLQKIVVGEPSRVDAIRILEAAVGAYESKDNVIFTYAALAACVDLSMRYMHDGVLPEKALMLAREVALTVGKRSHAISWVTKDDVAALVGEKTRIPVTDVSQEEGERLLDLEKRIHERVIGQDAAVKAVASALRRARTELRSTGKPIANFLFLGPTGVGKTELAKATAEVYFSSESSMVRFDMSEYQDQASVARLIGGNGQAGLLTEAIRRQPFALLLLDELEKAHPDILNLFLQVMDDGRLTDGVGRTVDFTNVILIATSNAGTQFIQDEVVKGTALADVKTALMENELRATYKPEFLNRFNDVIVFSPLSQDDVAAIAYLLVSKVIERLKAKNMTLTVTDAAIHELAVLGYDRKFGARPLRRVIEEKLENVIADALLGGKAARRDTLVFDAGLALHVEKATAL